MNSINIMNQQEIHHCRVCGLYQTTPPWGETGNYPSFNICSCCGTEFGADDYDRTAVIDRRKAWLNTGAHWFQPDRKPADWALEKQLAQIPEIFQD